MKTISRNDFRKTVQAHALEVITEDGTHHPHFEPVTAAEAQAHMERFANVL